MYLVPAFHLDDNIFYRMIQPNALVRFLTIFLVFIGGHATVYAQTTESQSLNPDSLRSEILQLRTDLDVTRANLRTSHRKFRSGILVSGIGYTITIVGGVLLGSSKYSDWGQPLVIAGGAVGFSGALLLLNSNRFIGQAGGLSQASTSSSSSYRSELIDRRDR